MTANRPILRRDDAKTVLSAPTGETLKVFERKRIYLADEYDLAIRERLAGRYAFILAINGYSRITDEQCRAWGVKAGAYEKACEVLLRQAVSSLRSGYPGIDVRIIHGASDMGVDRSAVAAARELGCEQLGFNCPEFMAYVPDDDVPVYVAEHQEAYSDAFARSADVLIAANGRMQAFRMDIAALLVHSKHLITVNVIQKLSTCGGPPALGPDGKIEDAVAHFEQRAHVIGRSRLVQPAADAWRDAVLEINDRLSNICRSVLPADLAPAIPDT